MVKILMEELDNHLKVIYILLLRFIRPWVSVSENISPTSGYCSTNRKARKYTALKTNSYQKHIKFLRVRTPDPSPTPNPEKREDSGLPRRAPSHHSWLQNAFASTLEVRFEALMDCCQLLRLGFLDPKWKSFAQCLFLSKKSVVPILSDTCKLAFISTYIFSNMCIDIYVHNHIYDYLYTFNHKCQAPACDISCRSITEEQCQHHRKRALCRLQSPRIFQSEVWCLSSQGPSSPHHPGKKFTPELKICVATLGWSLFHLPASRLTPKASWHVKNGPKSWHKSYPWGWWSSTVIKFTSSSSGRRKKWNHREGSTDTTPSGRSMICSEAHDLKGQWLQAVFLVKKIMENHPKLQVDVAVHWLFIVNWDVFFVAAFPP